MKPAMPIHSRTRYRDDLVSILNFSIASVENETIATHCREFLAREEACAVADPDLAFLLNWVQCGRGGQQLTVISVVCPDYAVEATADGQFRYTFGTINAGIGVAGRRIFRSLSSVDRFLRDQLGLTALSYEVYVGDFEGFSEQNLTRVGISEREFEAKTLGQRESLEREAPFPVVARLFSERCAGKSGWLRELNRMRIRLAEPDIRVSLNRQLIRDIAWERRALYERLFAEEQAQPAVIEMLIELQAAEYAVIGELVVRDKANPLLLVAGSEKLSRFYGLASRTPILCLRAENI